MQGAECRGNFFYYFYILRFDTCLLIAGRQVRYSAVLPCCLVFSFIHSNFQLIGFSGKRDGTAEPQNIEFKM